VQVAVHGVEQALGQCFVGLQGPVQQIEPRITKQVRRAAVLAFCEQRPVGFAQWGDKGREIRQRFDRPALLEMPQRPDYPACAEIQVVKTVDRRLGVVERMRAPAHAGLVGRQGRIGNTPDRLAGGSFVPRRGLQRLVPRGVEQAGHHGRTLMACGPPWRRTGKPNRCAPRSDSVAPA